MQQRPRYGYDRNISILILKCFLIFHGHCSNCLKKNIQASHTHTQMEYAGWTQKQEKKRELSCNQQMVYFDKSKLVSFIQIAIEKKRSKNIYMKTIKSTNDIWYFNIKSDLHTLFSPRPFRVDLDFCHESFAAIWFIALAFTWRRNNYSINHGIAHIAQILCSHHSQQIIYDFKLHLQMLILINSKKKTAKKLFIAAENELNRSDCKMAASFKLVRTCSGHHEMSNVLYKPSLPYFRSLGQSETHFEQKTSFMNVGFVNQEMGRIK